MRDLAVDDVVRLTRDIPERELTRGETGVIRSKWFAPQVTLEVEFRHTGQEFDTRCLVLPDQIELDDEAAFAV